VVNLASRAGDLFESWVKRSAGVRFLHLDGPAGGVLDVIDNCCSACRGIAILAPVLFE
jgi:CDP-diglyceride synthetase